MRKLLNLQRLEQMFNAVYPEESVQAMGAQSKLLEGFSNGQIKRSIHRKLTAQNPKTLKEAVKLVQCRRNN